MSADSPGFSSESNEPSEPKVPPAMNSEYGTGSENDPSMTQEEEWDAAEAAEAARNGGGTGYDYGSDFGAAATRTEHRLDAQADDQRPVTSAELQAAVSTVAAQYEAKLEAVGAEYQEKLTTALDALETRHQAERAALKGEIDALRKELADNRDQGSAAGAEQSPNVEIPPEGTYRPHVTWTTLPPEGRAIDETSPTGIGRKPDGEQIRDMESDLPKSPLQKALDETLEESDDVRDAIGNLAETVDDFWKHGPGPAGAHHAIVGHDVYTAQPEQSPPVNDLVGSAAVMAVVTVAGIDRLVHHLRERNPSRDHSGH